MSLSAGSFDEVVLHGSPENFPCSLTLRPSLGRTTSLLVLAFIPTALLAIPATMAAVLLRHKGMTTLLASDPVAFLALALQVVLWCVLAAMPVKTIGGRIGIVRRVLVEPTRVLFIERSLSGTVRLRCSTAEFRGIAHVVRATLNGTHHELILVHAEARRSILLMTAPLISQAVIDEVRLKLGLPEVPAREMFKTSRPRFTPKALPAMARA
ncbi:MAG: hypothetical protein F9K44_10075 [Hyphomicrobiaceae bacterium]|nr:MAG: hypothetical protein F9K44_10075 [Hyphomicrobiaceae bacterium]